MSAYTKAVKTKSIFIYILIVTLFLTLGWAVWMLFESKIKEAESKKNNPSAQK